MLKAPFPYFGGKSRVCDDVWLAFGDVPNYVEPHFGSGAVLLGRPHEPGIETVNDSEGFVVNAWRAIKHDPDQVAYYADQPVFECNLHAEHAYLLGIKAGLVPRLEGDIDYYDARVAGYWIWGMCTWIGGGWCYADGPWSVDAAGRLVKSGGGVNRPGARRILPHLGFNKKVNSDTPLIPWMHALSDRLSRVRVTCGDWRRVTGRSVTTLNGLTGVFLDPPYEHDSRDTDIYAQDHIDIAQDVRQWAIDNGDNPLMRIALCGYESDTYRMPDTWRELAWNASGMGYGRTKQGKENTGRERIWFSPHCIDTTRQMNLFS